MSHDQSIRTAPTRWDSARAGKAPGGRPQYHVRDIVNRRTAGVFGSESLALASLKGADDGRFSINNHEGDWCEVLVRGGERFVRHDLMADGSPAAFISIDILSRGHHASDGPT